MPTINLGSKKYTLVTTQKAGVRNMKFTKGGVNYYLPMTTIVQPSPCIRVMDPNGTTWYTPEPVKYTDSHDFVYNWTGRGVLRTGNAGGNSFGRDGRGTGTGPINVLSVSGIGGAFKISINFNANFYNVSIWDTTECDKDQPSCRSTRRDYRSLLESTPMPMVHNPYGFGLVNGAPAKPARVTSAVTTGQTGRFNYSSNIHNLGIGVWYTIANAAVVWEGGDISGDTGPLIGCSDGFSVYSIIEVCRTNYNTILIRYDHTGSQNPAASGSYTSYSKGWTYSSIGVWYESDGTATYSLPRSGEVVTEGWDPEW